MEQLITVTKNMVNYFYSELPKKNLSIGKNKLDQCFEILKQNYFVSDNDKRLFNSLISEIELLKDVQVRECIKNHLGKLLVDRVRFLSHSLDNSNHQYYKLCNASNDKIYFDPEITESEINETRLKLYNIGINEIEFHGLDSFLNPGNDHRFKIPNENIVLERFEKDKCYDLVKIILPYLRESKEIKFIDKYLPNYLSRFHLENFFKAIDNSVKICLITLNEVEYCKGRKEKDMEKAKNNYGEFRKLEDKYSVIVKDINQSGHLERYIITDKYEITLPGGFDQFSKDGIPYIDDENKILKMFIEKK